MIKLMRGDCEIRLQELPDSYVDLVVTSPPYDALRKYKGVEEPWNFDKFKRVAKQLYRVLKPGAVIVWVVGDSTVNGSESTSSFRQAIFFTELGLNLHDTMIYAKNNPIPQNHNRYEQCFEYMFVLSKGKPKTFNGLTEPTKLAGQTMDWGNRKTVMDPNQCRRHRGTELIKVKDTKLRKNIFWYSIGGGKTGHPAVFPLQLATDHILSWSNPGDIVLDPFMGSGTTGVSAIFHYRSFIGVELSQEYYRSSKRRIREAAHEAKDRHYEACQ